MKSLCGFAEPIVRVIFNLGFLFCAFYFKECTKAKGTIWDYSQLGIIHSLGLLTIHNDWGVMTWNRVTGNRVTGNRVTGNRWSRE